MLCGFYAYALATNGRPDFTKSDTYLFYFAGTFVQIVLVGRNSDRATSDEANKGVDKLAQIALSEQVPLYDEKHNMFLPPVVEHQHPHCTRYSHQRGCDRAD